MSTDTWRPRELSSMEGRTAVVTGANSGIGFEITRELLQHGASVIMAVRDEERGTDAAEKLREELTTSGSLSVHRCDLAALDSVESFATTVRDEVARLDYLFNNAGVMAIPRSETADGFERQLGINHLGHFALTGHLLDMLLADGESRVITQSSGMHERGSIDFEDLQSERSYGKWAAYAQSKLANLLFAFELQRRLDDADAETVLSLAVHPGYADTSLQTRGPRQSGSRIRTWLMQLSNRLFAQSAQNGAWPSLYAATAPELSGGEYVGPTGLLTMRGPPGVQPPSERANEQHTAERLWTASEELTGVEYRLLPGENSFR
ncbi:MAG: oxidoreductase [Halodesulfurarchaeum sp.]